MIAAESGQTTEAASRGLFVEAIEQLAGNPADAYRARNNYANGLLVRAQDRLYNHAFQIASGVSYPLIRSAWSASATSTMISTFWRRSTRSPISLIEPPATYCMEM